MLLLLAANPFTLSAGLNDYSLKKFSSQLPNVPLPPNTIEADYDARVGGLIGNGDNCDFRAAITYETELSEEEIRSHYRGLMAQGARGNGKVEIKVLFKETKWAPGPDKRYYEIYILDEGYSSGFDIRCA